VDAELEVTFKKITFLKIKIALRSKLTFSMVETYQIWIKLVGIWSLGEPFCKWGGFQR
jgi:hypothetical protein